MKLSKGKLTAGLSLIAVCLGVMLLLSGCGAAFNSESSAEAVEMDDVASAPEMEVPEAAIAEDSGWMPSEDVAAEQSAGTGESADGTTGVPQDASTNVQQDTRKVVYSADVSMISESFDAHLKQIKDRAASLGGYISYENLNAGQTYYSDDYYMPTRTCELTVRIPIPSYNMYLEEVCAIGTLQTRSQSGQDVTLTFYDQQTRLDTLNKQLDKLQEILDRTTELEDVVAMVQEISRVQLEIEQLTTEHKQLADMVDMATINISLSEYAYPTEKPKDEPITFGTRISMASSDAIDGLVAFFQGFVLFFVGNWPWLIVLALAIWLPLHLCIWRPRRKKRKAKAQQAPPAQTAQPVQETPPPGDNKKA